MLRPDDPRHRGRGGRIARTVVSETLKRSGSAILLLLAGLATTVLLSWGCALLPPPTAVTAQEQTPQWIGPVPRVFGEAPWQKIERQGLGATLVEFAAAPRSGTQFSPSGTPVDRQQALLTGLPCRALRWELNIPVTGSHAPTWRDGLQFPLSNRSLLPLVPCWPGFAIDWLLFSLVWALVLWAGAAHRRRWRRRRGRCAACGYPAGRGAARCPECGSAGATIDPRANPSLTRTAAVSSSQPNRPSAAA